uniref:Uncharacterized protein n=1 Tax=Arundo donax TaxID=35708 RepID=A0A0A9A1U7_ARUDO
MVRQSPFLKWFVMRAS